MEPELPNEHDRPRGGIDDLAGVTLSFDGDLVVARKQAGVAGDRGQEVVQVVRDRPQRERIVRLSDCEQMGHVECFGRTRPRL